MFRLSAILASLILTCAVGVTGAAASNACQRETGGRCKGGQTAPPASSTTGTVTRKPAPPVSGHRLKPYDDYTAAQREKIMEQARELCRRKYGAPSRLYRIDYAQNRIWCEPPSY